VQVPVYNVAGEVVDNIEISEHVFGVEFNEPVVPAGNGQYQDPR
jgi:ribosomal protein L4